MDFNVGDKVRVIVKDSSFTGRTGEIVNVIDQTMPYGVRLDWVPSALAASMPYFFKAKEIELITD